jgi:hypothetical protein
VCHLCRILRRTVGLTSVARPALNISLTSSLPKRSFHPKRWVDGPDSCERFHEPRHKYGVERIRYVCRGRISRWSGDLIANKQ